MPPRTTPLVNGEIYHVVSRGHASSPIFGQKSDYVLCLKTFSYYQNKKPPFRFSKFKNMTNNQRNVVIESLQGKKDFLVEILAYCLMPNHFHFLLKQIKNDGIKEFMRLTNDSYARYFNTKYRRKGALFESPFKAIRIETDKQLAHVSRYIHLNPYSSFIVKNINDLLKYPFSSLNEYLRKDDDICQQELLWGQFSSVAKYKQFILDQADYQRTLQIIKHQLLEN